MPSSCCIKGCSNKQTFYGYSMFGFPNDPDVRNQWVKALRPDSLEPKTHHRVCEVHFEPALVHFVGSRKELKKNAVPSLFCNCTKLILAEGKNFEKSDTDEKSSFISGVTSLDHSYSQTLSVLTERGKETDCNNMQHVDFSVKRRSWKHSPNCNIMRKPLKNTQKLKTQAGNDDKMLPTMNIEKPDVREKTTSGRIKHLRNKVVKTTKTNQCRLKLQLKSALDENAKLRKELLMLKKAMLPVTMLPSNKVKLVQLIKAV